MVSLFPPNTRQTMTFLNPLDARIPKIQFSYFAEFWVRVTSGARGSVSVGFGAGGGGGGVNCVCTLSESEARRATNKGDATCSTNVF